MDLHPIWPVEFDRALITGQIGCKSTEINWHLKPLHCMPAWSNLVVIISMDLLPIRLGINYWSNWVEIHWDYIVSLPGWIGYHVSEFTPNLKGGSNSIPPVEFDWALNTGQIGWKFTEITFVCLPVHSMAAWSNLVVIISMDLLPIWPVEFDRALITGQIG